MLLSEGHGKRWGWVIYQCVMCDASDAVDVGEAGDAEPAKHRSHRIATSPCNVEQRSINTFILSASVTPSDLEPPGIFYVQYVPQHRGKMNDTTPSIYCI
jgi:hypothetical protein